jgi:hypothetical protein
VRQFQAIQHIDGALTLKVVPRGATLDPAVERLAREFVGKYMPGTRVQLDVVSEIPLTAAGKRRLVIVEKPTPAS